LGSSGISWTICKQYAPRSRQIIMPTPHHSIFTRWMLFLMPNQQYQSTKGSQRHKTANEIMQQIQVKRNWSAIVYYCNDISVNTAHIKVKSSLIIFIHRKNTICLTITSNVDASHFYLLTLTDILFRQEYMTYFE